MSWDVTVPDTFPESHLWLKVGFDSDKHYHHFYPLDAMLERVIAVATCLAGCLSVTAGIVSKRKQLAS